jgi:hypothetical protein
MQASIHTQELMRTRNADVARAANARRQRGNPAGDPRRGRVRLAVSIVLATLAGGPRRGGRTATRRDAAGARRVAG